jgi:hypothetical protein
MRRRRGVLLVALVFAAACGGGGDSDVGGFAHVPQAVELVGSYDVTTMRGESTTLGVATVGFGNGELGLRLSSGDVVLHPRFLMHGALQRDGSIVLTGRLENADVIMDLHGSAHAEQRDGILRIAGTFDDDDFVMERPFGADQSAQSGRYRFRFVPSPQNFHGNSTVDVDLHVAASGETTVETDGAELDADGAQIATWSSTTVVVAPSGRLQLEAQYDFVAGGGCFFGGHCHVTAVGILPVGAADEPGPGRYAYELALPPNPSPITTGDVEVTRVATVP